MRATLAGVLAPLSLALSLLSLGGTLRAQERAPEPLTLGEVLANVDDRQPLLSAARRGRDAAEADRLSADGAFDVSWRTRAATSALGYYQNGRVDSVLEQPTPLWGTTFFAGYRLGVGSFPTYYGMQETNEYGEVRAGVSVPLWRNGPIDRRRANVTRARLGVDAAALGVELQRLELARTAAQRYWSWVAAGRRLVIARELMRVAEARDDGLARRVSSGDLPAFERLDNQRAVLQRRASVVAAERSLEQAAIDLSLYLRDGEGNPLLPPTSRLPSALPEPTENPGSAGLGRDLATAAARRPELRRLELQRSQAEVERRWAENQRAPAVDVVLAASQDLGQGSTTRSQPEVEAALVLDIPLQTRVATGRVRAAEAAIAGLDAQTRFTRDRIEAEVRDAHSALVAARQRVEVTRGELALARDLEAAERARFDAGDSTLLIVNLREQATAEAATREVDALADWHRAEVAWRAALASLGAGR